MNDKNLQRIYSLTFASVYPLYIQKVERKGQPREAVDQVITWLTGYSPEAIDSQVKANCTFETFFDQAPQLNPRAELIKGTICGVKIEEIEDPLYKKIRYLDKLVDEVAKGRAMEKILR